MNCNIQIIMNKLKLSNLEQAAQIIVKYKQPKKFYISDDWKVLENSKISKEFFFVSYRQTIDFVNKVAAIA